MLTTAMSNFLPAKLAMLMIPSVFLDSEECRSFGKAVILPHRLLHGMARRLWITEFHRILCLKRYTFPREFTVKNHCYVRGVPITVQIRKSLRQPHSGTWRWCHKNGSQIFLIQSDEVADYGLRTRDLQPLSALPDALDLIKRTAIRQQTVGISPLPRDGESRKIIKGYTSHVTGAPLLRRPRCLRRGTRRRCRASGCGVAIRTAA
jgi:hypothetical protein